MTTQYDPEKGHIEEFDKLEVSPVKDTDVAATISQSSGRGTGIEANSSQALQISVETERSIRRKLDRRLLPLVAFLYLLAYLDRGNIGNANIAGLSKDLHISGPEYQWLLTIFYIAYIFFEWFALMWKIFPPHIWATLCVVGWGLASTLQAAAYSWSGMMAARFFLGFFEAGYGPGIPYLLSFFYLRHEIGFRIGLFLSAAPLATCFAGALAYGITSDKTPAIENWRILFIVEGLPCFLAAALTFFFLPDSPEKARFLTEEEKGAARARAVRQVGTGGHESEMSYLLALMYFSCNVSFSSLPVFLPTIIKAMGYTAINSQGLTAPPYFVAFILVILTTRISDRTQQRGITIFILSLIAFTGYAMLASSKIVAVRYTGVFLAAAGVFPSIGNILPWVLNNQGSDTRRGMGIAILNFIGQCGPLLGTRLFPEGDGPYYSKGLWVCAAFMLFNAFLAATLRCLLVWENRKLDEKYGERDESVKTRVGEENDGPRFRYVL
ncbi:hypothetical protein HYFRA_00007859 [Hymenoscyphus fraxineus]|uniref:Major facilitator superfamily (MFS) profile domain-containing protein n=1 Tax=Hymenoscyphus fraxineus TaxID=746836 RepID=A0A9N9PN50_9HELO|nr:hypothetical protein HYFRA_00007859 [Hymenoscyphus fraxineus]